MRECYKKIAKEKEAAQQTARRRAKPAAVIDVKALRLKNMRTLAPVAKKPEPPPINIEVLLSSFALARTLDGGVF